MEERKVGVVESHSRLQQEMAANEVINAEDLHRDDSFHSQMTNNILLNRSSEADFHSQSSSAVPWKKPSPIELSGANSRT